MGVPYLFRCPISLDLFTDPVTLCTGQTYDRHSIERWLQAGNKTCPVTMQPLCDTTLVPNHNLRHLIEQWLLTNPDMNQRVEPLGACSNPRSDTDLPISLSTIRSILESESVAADLKIDMLNQIRMSLIESDVNEASMIQLGFFPLLLELIFQYPMDLTLSNLELFELSLDSLLMLSPSNNLDSLNKILANSHNLASLVLLLSHGSAKVKISLCCLLEIIALSEQTQELTLIIGQSPHVIRALVTILHNSADPPAPDACIRALKGLCSLEANRENAIREGVVHGLTSYLYENSTMNGDSSKALETLECLLENEGEKSNLEKTKNLIRVLVKHIFVVPSENEGSEYAVSVLLKMCYDSEWACDKSISVGVVTQLLLLIQSQCSARAKTNARQLLKLLKLKDKFG